MHNLGEISMHTADAWPLPGSHVPQINPTDTRVRSFSRCHVLHVLHVIPSSQSHVHADSHAPRPPICLLSVSEHGSIEWDVLFISSTECKFETFGN